MKILTHHPGGRHDDVELSGINLPSGSVPGTVLESPRIRFRGGGGLGTEFVENNCRPDNFRVNRYLWVSRGAEAAHQDHRRVLAAGPGGTTARGRLWPLGGPPGRPLVSEAFLSNKNSP